MPLTTVDIPKELMDFLDGLVARGLRHSRKEVILEALSYYKALDMVSWRPPVYQLGGSRVVIIDSECLSELARVAEGSGAEGAERLREVGRKVGRALRDRLIASGLLERADLEDPGGVFELLKALGWGLFKTSGDGRRVVAVQLAVPPPLLHGYLEGLLGVELRAEQTGAKDVAIFTVVEVVRAEVREAQASTQENL
jgi:hypothetical protein